MDRKTKWIRIIHVAKKQLCLDEYAYRSILASAGVSSATEITTLEQFTTIMHIFEKLGFKSDSIKDSEFCSKKQLYVIRKLWGTCSRSKDEKSLQRMVKRISHVDDINFLTKSEATKVILALRKMTWAAGYNPDSLLDIEKESISQ